MFDSRAHGQNRPHAIFRRHYTACGHRMAHRKWKEIKQQPSLLPGPAVPGCSLVSSHFLWAILCPKAVLSTGWGWRSVTWVGLTLPSCPANSAFPSAELGCRLTANVNPTQVTDQQPHHVDNLLTNRPPAAQPLHSRRPIAGNGAGHPLR